MDTLEATDAVTADERRSLLDGHVPVMYGSALADAESGRRPHTAPLLERITLTSSRMGGYVGTKTATVLSSNSFSILLLFLPLGIASGVLGWSDVAIFACNFCAIIPLAAVLSFATEELALQVGDTLGGLINATFGNAVELIVSRNSCAHD